MHMRYQYWAIWRDLCRHQNSYTVHNFQWSDIWRLHWAYSNSEIVPKSIFLHHILKTLQKGKKWEILQCYHYLKNHFSLLFSATYIENIFRYFCYCCGYFKWENKQARPFYSSLARNERGLSPLYLACFSILQRLSLFKFSSMWF